MKMKEFLQRHLCKQSPLQYPPKFFSANVHFPIPPLLFHEIILTTLINSPFLYTSALFHLPILEHSDPYNLHQKCFLYRSHLANLTCVKGPMSNGVL